MTDDLSAPKPDRDTFQGTLFERRGATTLWRLIAAELQREIVAGLFVAGQQLPTESELAERFLVHRNTVRRALEVLRSKGLVRAEQGRGNFVQERIVRHEVGPNTRLTASLHNLYRLGQRHFISASRMSPDQGLAEDLRLPANRYVRKVETLNTIDGIPVTVSSSFFPLPRFNGIEKLIQETGSFTEAWRQFGIHQYRRDQFRITAISLSNADAKLLKMKGRSPAILTTNINVDADGTPIIVSRTRIAPQFMELVVRFPDIG